MSPGVIGYRTPASSDINLNHATAPVTHKFLAP